MVQSFLVTCLMIGLMMATPSQQQSSPLTKSLPKLPGSGFLHKRFAPLSNLANLDIKSQLNQLYDKMQPMWGRKNNPKSFGSVIAEISATQPGAESMTSYTVPGSGITHIKSDSEIPLSVADSASSLKSPSSSYTSTDDDDKMMTSASSSRSKRNFPDIPVSDHPVRTYSSKRHRDRARDRDGDYEMDREPDRRKRRRRIRKHRSRGSYGSRPHDSYQPQPLSFPNFMSQMQQPIPFNINNPFGPFGPSPVLFGAKIGDPMHNNYEADRKASESQQRPESTSSSQYTKSGPVPGMPMPFPFPLMFPPGMPPMPLIPGLPPPFMQQIPGMNPFAPFPMIMSLQSAISPTTTTTTPAPKVKTASPPKTSVEDDGSITIAGIRPQSIVNKISAVVRQTGMNKVIGSALTSVLSQVKDAGNSVASQVVRNLGEQVSVSLTSDGDSDSGSSSGSTRPSKVSPSESSKSILKLGETKISFKPTNSGLSISFGKA